ncbi:MFS transporter [Neorhizobium sp. NCHU2750]|uniref:MFS transporter n=1 Tax=Neorhizobium sp. NCHU2750 TaxID=1825976 RepID=UPI000E74DED4
MSFSLSSFRTVSVLAVGQLLGWGTTFEAVGAIGRKLAPDLGLPNEIVFAGLSVMMVTSALASPLTGRMLDRMGASRVLSIGTLFFALGLCVLASAQGVISYVVAWTILGLGGAFCLNAPAFTAVVEREGYEGKRTITILMLFTGLSPSIAWPLLNLSHDMIGWRTTFLCGAALQIFVCLPLYLFGLPKATAFTRSGTSADIAPVPLTPAGKKLAFVLVAMATAIASFVTFGLSPSLQEVLRQSGATPELALQLAAARGVLGISARGFDMALGKRGNPFLTSVTGMSLMIASFACLFFLPPSGFKLYAFITLYGFGAGILVVARALLPLALFSPREYGRQASRLMLPQNIANAAAPILFTALLDRTGVGIVLAISIALAFIAFASIITLISLVRKARAEERRAGNTAIPLPP